MTFSWKLINCFLVLLASLVGYGCVNGDFNSGGFNGFNQGMLSAFSFNGTSSVISENSTNFTFGSTMTIEFYFKAASSASSQYFIHFKTGIYPLANVSIFPAGNVSFLVPSDCVGTGGGFASVGTYNDNQWHHFAGVVNGANEYIYIDGVLSNSGSLSSTTCPVNAVHIGNQNGGSILNGAMDEIRVSNTVRYSSNFTPSHFPFSIDGNTLLLEHADNLTNMDYVVNGGIWSATSVGLVSAPYP